MGARAGKQAFRMTTQRRVILDELRSTGSHPTADQLYERVRRRLPRISLGTVYRNLEILAGQGVIQKRKQAHQVKLENADVAAPNEGNPLCLAVHGER